MSSSRGILVWCDPSQVEWIRQVLLRAQAEPSAAGTSAKGQSAAVAGAFGVPSIPDLRAALSTASDSIFLFAGSGDFGAIPTDATTVHAARARNVVFACLEPVPAGCLELAGAGWLSEVHGQRPIDSIRTIGLPRFSRSWREVADVLPLFGPPRFASLTVRAPAGLLSLGSLLFGAIDLLKVILGEPESVDAAYTSEGGKAPRAAPIDSLRDLHGSMSALIRYADARHAILSADSLAGGEPFELSLGSPQGRLRVASSAWDWTSPDGRVRDRSTPAPPNPDTLTEIVAESIRRMLDPAVPREAPLNIDSALATAQAALLSAHTGAPERPAVMSKVVSHQ